MIFIQYEFFSKFQMLFTRLFKDVEVGSLLEYL